MYVYGTCFLSVVVTPVAVSDFMMCRGLCTCIEML